MRFGDAFTMAVPPRYDVPHLFFVISDPSKNEGIYHIVNVTSNYVRAGKECVLNLGDHEWITKPSYIAFRDARQINPNQNLDALIGSCITMQKPLETWVLGKIVRMAKTSKSFREEFKQFL